MIGILPAAGTATRIHGLPKMLLPTPDGALIATHYQRMVEAGCRRVIVGTRTPNMAYVKMACGGAAAVFEANTGTMSETVLLAHRYTDDMLVLFGLPDTYFEDAEAYWKLADALEDGADVAVGVFTTRPDQHVKLGMCRFEGNRVTEVVDKPAETDLTHCWGVLAWQPVFWDYLRASDPHVGYALPHALAAGLDVRAVVMEGRYWDCGTSDEYFDLIRHLA